MPADSPAQTSSASSKNAKKVSAPADTGMDAGSVKDGVYRNKWLGLACKIPAGWVLRTEEMNTRAGVGANGESAEAPAKTATSAAKSAAEMGHPESAGGRVLLAAFSRPPEAKGEDVNSSIVIAVESVDAYPGLKEAVQYMGPVGDAAKAEGFEMDEEPYGIAIGTTTLVRGDFHKNVGSRVMRQSTLAMLAKGYAVSITVIGGTEDEVEELIDGLEFQKSPASSAAKK